MNFLPRLNAFGSYEMYDRNFLGTYAKGYIALKIHSLGNNPEKEVAVVHYRNFRILTKDPARYSRDMGTYPLIEYK